MSRLDIRLLGPPEVELDGQPIEVDTRKAIAMLALLAVSGQPYRRDSLAAFLWPESDQTRARASLRRTLSTLGTALDGEWLTISRESIGIQATAGYTLDLDQFHASLDAARERGAANPQALEAAVSLYRDDFMAGFGLRDSPPFDDWQYRQADAARRKLAWALEQLTACCVNAGDWHGAIDNARRWLGIDPLREPVHRQLMQIYASMGDRASALRQYRTCVQILNRELGVGPLEETTDLYNAIMESRLPAPMLPPQGVSESPIKPVPSKLPLVGRDREYATLIDAYNAIGQSGRLVVIEGEAGIGKTRLAGEFVEHIRRNEGAVISGACYSGESDLAYGLVADVLRSSLDLPAFDCVLSRLAPHVRNEISRLLPELSDFGAPAPPPLESPGALDRFHDGIVQFMLSLQCAGEPTLLFIDDLQWADDASLNLVAYLVRRLHRSPICVLVNWRTEDVSPSHPLRQLLASTMRAGSATLIELGPLTPGDISTLVLSVATEGQAALSDALYEESEGIPFFAVEYLAYLAGELDPKDCHLPMPGSVRDLVRSRLQSVGSAGQQLLTTAAVIGRSFDFDLLRESSGRSETESVETLDRLLSHGLIRESSGATQLEIAYDFSHQTVRTVLYEDASLARRRLIHQRVAGALERRSRRRRQGDLAGQIAYHYRLAGMESKAAHYYRLAGDYARALYGNAEALSHYRMALALGYPELAVLYEAIGDLETLGGRYADALDSYQTAAAHSDTVLLPVIERKLGAVHQRLGDWEIAEGHFEAAVNRFAEDHLAERAQVLADWSLTAHQHRDTRRALEICHRALALALESNDNPTLAQIYNVLGILARSQGNAVETARHLEQSLKLANAMDDSGARIAALNNLALVCADQREYERAISLTKDALELCRSIGDRHREAALLNNLADFCHKAADERRSMDYLKEAVAIFAEIGQRTDAIHPEIWKLVEW